MFAVREYFIYVYLVPDLLIRAGTLTGCRIYLPSNLHLLFFTSFTLSLPEDLESVEQSIARRDEQFFPRFATLMIPRAVQLEIDGTVVPRMFTAKWRAISRDRRVGDVPKPRGLPSH